MPNKLKLSEDEADAGIAEAVFPAATFPTTDKRLTSAQLVAILVETAVPVESY